MAEELKTWVETGEGETRASDQKKNRGFRVDMALVNYYVSSAHMGLHQDAYESSNVSIIALSIGDEALFRVGGTENRNKPWDGVLLASGDLIIFGGLKRRAFPRSAKNKAAHPARGLRPKRGAD